MLLVSWPMLLSAQIYRYQDESGGWHFTDDPPAGVGAERILDITETNKPGVSAATVDLAAQLESLFESISPVARATLAVVSVRSELGDASGFFCSEQGHILTNRHVVQPAAVEVVPLPDGARTAEEQDLQGLEAQLQAARGQLVLMEQDLAGYQRVLERATDDTARQWAQEAHDQLNLRYRAEQEKVQTLSGRLAEQGKHLETLRVDPRQGEGGSETATSFDIVLKDGTELTANLVGLGANHDLALLKVDGFRTPYLRLDATSSVSLGQRVFAVGSPLGMQEALASGVIIHFNDQQIITDTQILPGNSGGPLIADTGALIGITASNNAAPGEPPATSGLGRSIPVGAALNEFREVLPNIGVVEPTAPEIERFPPSGEPADGFTRE